MDLPAELLEWIKEKVRTGEITMDREGNITGMTEPETPVGAASRFVEHSEETRELWMGSRQKWVNDDGKTFLDVFHGRMKKRKEDETQRSILADIDTTQFHAPEKD